jgi:RNA polymerase sigma-70 factor, ECF subfamily
VSHPHPQGAALRFERRRHTITAPRETELGGPHHGEPAPHTAPDDHAPAAPGGPIRAILRAAVRERPPVATDTTLAREIRAGNPAAFEDLVLTYAQPLTAFAWRYLRSTDAAADVAQDVFAHVWEHRAQLVIRGSVRAYLFRAARNRALNLLDHERVEARWREAAAAGLLPESQPPMPASHRLEHAEIEAAVHAALDALPPRGREVARLRWIERLSVREIAEVLGIAVPTVSVHLTRTAKRLRALLLDV